MNKVIFTFFIVSNLNYNKYGQINLDITKSLVYKKLNTLRFPKKVNRKRLLVIITFFPDLYEIEIKTGPSPKNVRKLRQKLIEKTIIFQRFGSLLLIIGLFLPS